MKVFSAQMSRAELISVSRRHTDVSLVFLLCRICHFLRSVLRWSATTTAKVLRDQPVRVQRHWLDLVRPSSPATFNLCAVKVGDCAERQAVLWDYGSILNPSSSVDPANLLDGRQTGPL